MKHELATEYYLMPVAVSDACDREDWSIGRISPDGTQVLNKCAPHLRMPDHATRLRKDAFRDRMTAIDGVRVLTPEEARELSHSWDPPELEDVPKGVPKGKP